MLVLLSWNKSGKERKPLRFNLKCNYTFRQNVSLQHKRSAIDYWFRARAFVTCVERVDLNRTHAGSVRIALFPGSLFFLPSPPPWEQGCNASSMESAINLATRRISRSRYLIKKAKQLLSMLSLIFVAKVCVKHLLTPLGTAGRRDGSQRLSRNSLHLVCTPWP